MSEMETHEVFAAETVRTYCVWAFGVSLVLSLILWFGPSWATKELPDGLSQPIGQWMLRLTLFGSAYFAVFFHRMARAGRS